MERRSATSSCEREKDGVSQRDILPGAAEGAIMDEKRIERGVREILAGIGEDVLNAEVLANTPRRVAAMYAEFFAAAGQNPADALGVVYEEAYEEMIVMKDIPFFSICEHHLLPFVGKADVVYVPKNGRIVGASKLARVVDIAAGKPQLQERLTSQIADALVERLDPHGVLVRIEASHLCMTLRGVKKAGAIMVTSAIRGRFYRDEASRAEAFALIG
jgi:GTP cyclohydrolase IA